MDSTARRSGGGLLEGLYRVIMRRTSVYATFVILGAFAGERAVDYGVHKLWERNNVGDGIIRESKCLCPICAVGKKPYVCAACKVIKKRYEDIPVLGQRPSE